VSRNVCLLLGLAAALGAVSVGLSRPSWLPLLETKAANSPAQEAGNTGHFKTSPNSLPPVRVLLGSRARKVHRLKIDGPYRVRLLDDWRILAQGETLPECDAHFADDAIQIGGNAFEHRGVQIDVLQTGTLWVNSRRYHGSLRLITDAQSRLRAIGLVDLESYVASVVNGEMPADFALAARRAQAIAARTYALYHMKSGGRGHDFDLYDNTRSQTYRGIETVDEADRRLAVETAASRKLAEDTAGIALTYNGRVINAYYSAVCGGHTAHGPSIFSDAAPPLIGVKCDGCTDAPRYRWQVDMPAADLYGRLGAYLDRIGRHVGEIQTVEATDNVDGRMPVVTVRGTKATERITTAALRSHVLKTGDLPSAFFSVSIENDLVRCRGRGWGHGVGFCQWGAHGLAQTGKSCVELLAHYYPGCQLRVIE